MPEGAYPTTYACVDGSLTVQSPLNLHFSQDAEGIEATAGHWLSAGGVDVAMFFVLGCASWASSVGKQFDANMHAR